MADLIEINIATLDGDIASMQEELEALRAEVGKAFDSIQDLDRMWNGPANDAFNQAFQNDKTAMDDMCATMAGLISYMENARDEYRKCEEAVSAEIDAIKI